MQSQKIKGNGPSPIRWRGKSSWAWGNCCEIQRLRGYCREQEISGWAGDWESGIDISLSEERTFMNSKKNDVPVAP